MGSEVTAPYYGNDSSVGQNYNERLQYTSVKESNGEDADSFVSHKSVSRSE